MFPAAALTHLKSLIARGHRFAITTHVNADGDGLGSEVALAVYLQQLGKEAYIFNHSQIPSNYEFLDPFGDIQLFDPARHGDIIRQCDAIFILDISHWQRLKQFGEFVRPLKIPKVCIDHHPTEEAFVDLDVVEPSASSTGELIFELLQGLQARIDGRIAEALYTAVMTDTGSFRYSNTNAHSHRVAAQLLEAGVRPHLVYQQVYENMPAARMRLLARILESLQFENNGQIVWFVIKQQDLELSGASYKDTEGFVDVPRSIKGVEISIMFFETPDDKVKASFRSKGNYVINGLANRFGGGGHPFAAGALIEENMQNAIPRVLEEARMLF